jgi:hypothetical protein
MGYEYGCRVATTAFAFREHTNPLIPNKINELENFFFCKGERLMRLMVRGDGYSGDARGTTIARWDIYSVIKE